MKTAALGSLLLRYQCKEVTALSIQK